DRPALVAVGRPRRGRRLRGRDRHAGVAERDVGDRALGGARRRDRARVPAGGRTRTPCTPHGVPGRGGARAGARRRVDRAPLVSGRRGDLPRGPRLRRRALRPRRLVARGPARRSVGARGRAGSDRRGRRASRRDAARQPGARARRPHARGRPLPLPAVDSGRAATLVERDGNPVAALLHDPAVLDDPGLADAAAAAARLASSHERLRTEVRAQIAELRASRRRLLRVADDERERLERRLREGAEARLAGVERRLRLAHEAADDAATRDGIARAQAQVEQALAELHELARGLHPRALSELGLAGALAGLAERAPLPVQVEIETGDLPPEVAATAYFVCSEGLANVAKYSGASRAVLRVVRRGGRLAVEVDDDGAGGADPSRGWGLRGLGDRVDALGGRLEVESPAGGGTRLRAELPL